MSREGKRGRTRRTARVSLHERIASLLGPRSDLPRSLPAGRRCCLTAGVLQAPVRRAAVAFVYVVGASSLLAWDGAVARQALDMLEVAFAAELARSCAGGAAGKAAAAGAGGSDGSGCGSGSDVGGSGSAYIVSAEKVQLDIPCLLPAVRRQCHLPGRAVLVTTTAVL